MSRTRLYEHCNLQMQVADTCSFMMVSFQCLTLESRKLNSK
ncbi:hypothetical protein [Wolbachia endosymbiont of Dactylopius coccus]